MKKLIYNLIILLPLSTAIISSAMDAEIKSAAAQVIKAKNKRKSNSDSPAATQNKKRKTTITKKSCPICGKECINNGLKLHMKAHTKSYTCVECGQLFKQTKEEQCFLCTKCEALTKKKKPYKCRMCVQSFAQELYLIEHIRIHTGEKPFKCIECVQSFARKRCLNVHIKRKHSFVPAAPPTALVSAECLHVPQQEDVLAKIETPTALVYEPLAPDASFPFAAALALDEHKDEPSITLQ